MEAGDCEGHASHAHTLWDCSGLFHSESRVYGYIDGVFCVLHLQARSWATATPTSRPTCGPWVAATPPPWWLRCGAGCSGAGKVTPTRSLLGVGKRTGSQVAVGGLLREQTWQERTCRLKFRLPRQELGLLHCLGCQRAAQRTGLPNAMGIV